MKSLFEQFGGTYRKESGYAIPNLETQTREILKLVFMDSGIYISCNINLLTSGKLNEYLVKIDS